jgi:hypothetical protein
MQKTEDRDALVVLIHGLGRTAASLWPLAVRLRRAGVEAARVPVLHLLLPASSRVAALVTTFLRDGRFRGRAA